MQFGMLYFAGNNGHPEKKIAIGSSCALTNGRILCYGDRVNVFPDQRDKDSKNAQTAFAMDHNHAYLMAISLAVEFQFSYIWFPTYLFLYVNNHVAGSFEK